MEVLALPTAPFAEHHVIDYVRRFCEGKKALSLSQDAAGNLLLHLKQGRARPKTRLCLTAHTDHPGFVADKMITPRRLRANWYGGVPSEYFKSAAVRFWVDGRWVKGRVRSIVLAPKTPRSTFRRPESAVIDMATDVAPGAIGMWDLPDPRVKGGRVWARACDDLAGLAALLCCIEDVIRKGADADACFLFTRAEEVGFVGAMAACRLRTIPADCAVVAVECSPQLMSARMGDGPILRVGDKASIFEPQLTAHCGMAAAEIAKSDRSFRHQRKLMDGGTCESTAYGIYGYQAAGVCLALGNYHNVNRSRKTIAPEFIDLNDFEGMVRWFAALVCLRAPLGRSTAGLRTELDGIQRKYAKLLKSTVREP